MKKRNLSTPQETIYYTEKMYDNLPLANVGGLYKIKGFDFKPEAWSKAINLYVSNNEVMRTRIIDDNPPTQYIEEFKEEEFEIIDLSSLSIAEREEIYTKWMQEQLTDKLYKCRIVKLSEEEHGFFTTIRHIITDGYSIGLFGQQASESYTNILNGIEQVVEPSPGYSAFLDREDEYRKSEKYIKDRDFWTEEFDEEPNLADLSMHPTTNPASNRYTKIIDDKLSKEIQTFCSKNNISVAVFFETVLFAYIKSVTGNEKVTIGSPALNRTGRTERTISGMFVNTLPLSLQISSDSDFKSLSEKVGSKKKLLFKHMQYPSSAIQKDLNQRFGYTGKIFDIIFSYQNASIFKKGEEKIESETEWIFNGYSGFGLTISFDDRDEKGEYVVNIDYQNEAYSKKNVERILDRLLLISEQVIEKPNIKLNEINLLTENDIKEYADFNSGKQVSITKNVIELFEEEVRKNPNSRALLFGENIDLTYAEANAYANSLGHTILSYNLEKGSVIPIIGERSYLTIIAMLAISKAGHAFCLLDPNEYPNDRIDALVNTCNSKLYITHGECDYMNPNIQTLNIDNQNSWSNNYENLNVEISLDDLFVILHTSGSSGTPKAVMISHEAISSMSKNNNHLIDGCNNCISFTTMTFDIFIMDVFLPLLNGKALVLSTPTEHKSPDLAKELIKKNPLSYTFFTPTRLKYYLKNSDKWENIVTLGIAGESLGQDLVRLIKEKTDAKVYNMYGPAEITMFCTVKEIIDDISIGRPATNYEVYVFNEHGQLLPPGVMGEIVVTGAGVSKGYMGNEAETNAKFITINGKKAYKTGDYGYIDEVIELIFCGRKDNQYKINGIRFEAQEIETAINMFNGINQSVVTLKKQGDSAYVIAYYEANGEIDEAALNEYLETKLASGVTPSIFIKMDKIPTTRTGKLSSGEKLPMPNFDELEQTKYVPPQNPIQESLCEIWESVLGKKEVGIKLNWKSLGGTSLNLLHMLDLVEKNLNKRIKPSDLAKSPTIESLEAVIKGRNTQIDLLKDFDFDNIVVNTNRQKTGNAILLVGVTGFLGSHILHELLENTDQKIYCLVRDVNKFKEMMQFYFKGDVYAFDNRIELIEGDIGKENIGLSPDIYEKLGDNVTSVVNAAANVKHYGALEEFEGPNVTGVYNIMKFCADANAKMHHISTVSVSGQGLTSQSRKNVGFSETDLDIGQGYEENVYIWTKFVGEQIIHKFQKKGVEASIYRTGRISSREKDGLFQHNSAESGFRIISDLVQKLKVIPETLEKMPIQVIPVDECANAIVTLMKEVHDNHTFHIYNPNLTTMADFLDVEGIQYQLINQFSFMNKLTELIAQDSRYVLVYQYIKDALRNPSNNTICNDATNAILENTDFTYPNPLGGNVNEDYTNLLSQYTKSIV